MTKQFVFRNRKFTKRPGAILAACLLWTSFSSGVVSAMELLSFDGDLEKIAEGFKFTEGPVADMNGNVYFTDIPNNRIHKWSVKDEKVSVFRENSGGANGLAFTPDGMLYVCEGDNGRVTAISPDGKTVKVLAEKYEGKEFNRPNDLWIDPKGGVYFTDPNYGKDPATQPGEHVYYLTPDRKKVVRVASDFKRPNGIIGTPDGKWIYITDRTAKKTFKYAIQKDGSLGDKKLFAEVGSDGMTLDDHGNLYVTLENVVVYSPDGEIVTEIEMPKPPSNVCFGGVANRTLFITARDGLYLRKMMVGGATASEARTDKEGVFRITIKALPEMLKYDTKEFTVKAGQKIRLLFVNADQPPHNLMVVSPGKADEICTAAIALGGKGFELEFKPKSPHVLQHTGMIDFGGYKVLNFAAPAKPGEYPYVCTFPGHGLMMRGMMHVVK